MTESDEESVEEAEANLRREGNGMHTFKVIHATIDPEQSRSVVTAIGAPADYSFRQVRAVLPLANAGGTAAPSTVVAFPPGTPPWFLLAVALATAPRAARPRAPT